MDGARKATLFLHTGLMEAGYVHLPAAAPWLEEFLFELAAFPNAKHDDQVDAFTQLLDEGERLRRTSQHVAIGAPSHVKERRSFEEAMFYQVGYLPKKVTAVGLGSALEDAEYSDFDQDIA